jgi:hypothetical protein
MVFALSFSVMFWLISQIYGMGWLFNIGLIIFIGIAIYTAYTRQHGNRFMRS